MITKEEYIKLIALIINLRDEAVNYGQRLYETNSGAGFNEEAFKYSEKQMENAEQLILDCLEGITEN